MSGNKFVIQFDATTLLGLYIHPVSAGQALPAFAAEIPEEHATTPAGFFKLVGGEVVERFSGTYEEKLAQLAKAEQIARDEFTLTSRGLQITDPTAWRDLLINRVREHANSMITMFRRAGAAYEEETWEIQRQEYISFLKDATNPTPYCDALAAARGLTREELLGLVGAKLAGLATIQGTQHRIEDQLEAAQTVEELQAIEVRFSL